MTATIDENKSETGQQPAIRAPRRFRIGQKHKFHSARRVLAEFGLRAIDGRSTAGRALNQWRQELIRDLGGIETLSTQKQTLIELCVRDRFLIDSVDAWIFQQPSVLNSRKKILYPIVLQRQQLADGLTRRLKDLGVERQTKPLPSLQEYLQSEEFDRDKGTNDEE